MEIQIATDVNISDAGLVHSKSWQDSHKGIVEEKFLITRTPYRQTEYFKKEIQVYGNEVYILYDNELPIGVLSLNVPNGEIKSLYISPDNQGKGNSMDDMEYMVGWDDNLKNPVSEGFIREGNIITSVSYNFILWAIAFGRAIGIEVYPKSFGIDM